MLKRLWSITLSLVLVFPLLGVGGCSLLAGKDDPFTLDYNTEEDATAVEFFIEGDSIETLLASNPFYSGNRPLPGKAMADFEKQRAEKVAATIETAAEMVADVDASESSIVALRTAYIELIGATGEEEFSEFKQLSIREIGDLALSEAVAREGYFSYAEVDSDNPYARSLMDYLAVGQAMEYASITLEDVNSLAGHAALLIKDIEASGSAEAKSAAASFEEKAPKLLESVGKALEPALEKQVVIQRQLELLSTADYYLAAEALGWMEAEGLKVEEALVALEPRDGFSEQDVADVRAAYAAVKEWNDSVQAHFDGLDTSSLVKVSARPAGNPFEVEPAYAQAAGYEPGAQFAKAVGALDMNPKADQGMLSWAWDGVKSAAGKVTTGIGVAVDTLGAEVHAVSRVTCGLYYGNSFEEVRDDIKGNIEKTVENYNRGVSGADTFTTALEYIEASEQAVGDAAGGVTEWGVEKIFGKGSVSGTAGWAVGGIAKLTAGMFTGLAKGTYKVANKKSSASDVAMGAIEIGLSMVGGSKVILKGSQVPGLVKGTGEAIKAGGGAMTNLVKGLSSAADRKAIISKMAEALKANKKLTTSQAMELISNSIRVEAAEAIEAALTSQRQKLIAKLQELAAKGFGGLKTNIAEGAQGMVKMVKEGMDDSMKGLIEALQEIVGKTGPDYIDNLIGSAVDNKIGELIAEAMTLAPGPELMSGTWSGTITITSYEIAEGIDPSEQGCDTQSLNQLVGRSYPAMFVISMSGSSGTVQFSGFEGASGSGTIAYNGGNVTMDVNADEVPLVFTGKASIVEGGGMRMAGTTRMESAGITLHCTWVTTK